VSLSASPYPLEDIQHSYAGSVVYPPGGRFGPRIQQHVQLVMLYSGEMEVVIDGVPNLVPSGTVTLLKPGHEEMFRFSAHHETWHRWIAIRFDPLSVRAAEELYRLPFSLPLTEEMNRLTDLMLSLMSSVSGDSPLLNSLALAALHLYSMNPAIPVHKKEKHPAVHLALQWIRQHYEEETTLPQLAHHAGVTAEHLIRLFKEHMSATPMNYLWKYRIQRGRDLLIHTGLSVSEVALRCGFKTSHHFAAMMKQLTGQTPTQIRSAYGVISKP
jgi:AraC-like DNA-binding protein